MRFRVRGRLNPVLEPGAGRGRVRTIEELVELSARDLGTMTLRADRIFRRLMARLYDTEGASGGRKWRPLSPDYARWKTRTLRGALETLRAENREIARIRGRRPPATPRLGSVDKILRFSGEMRDSFAERGGAHVAEWAARPRYLIRLGSRVPYAAFHAPGRLHNPRLPVRDPRQMTARQKDELLAAVVAVLRAKAVDLMRVARSLAKGLRAKGGLAP